jgi:hypothetical protein
MAHGYWMKLYVWLSQLQRIQFECPVVLELFIDIQGTCT